MNLQSPFATRAGNEPDARLLLAELQRVASMKTPEDESEHLPPDDEEQEESPEPAESPEPEKPE